jgi:restriction system protein
MIPDFQTLMRPVLEISAQGEIKIADAVAQLETQFALTEDEKAEMLPSGKQARFANRVHWARAYLKQAGLVESPRRGSFVITDDGRAVLLEAPPKININYLKKFEKFRTFQNRSTSGEVTEPEPAEVDETTPHEVLEKAHNQIQNALAVDLLERLQNSEPAFFEDVIVQLLLRMGFGHSAGAGRVLGRAGDNGVDGVINLDPLGVDQVYIQAKRYKSDNTVAAGDIRDFYGALGLKDVTKGIFVTTSQFSKSAQETAEKLGARIVLIDGARLARLMISYEIGCRVVETYTLATIEDSFFE